MNNKGCIHWWKIESPDGETSKGLCLRCGATKTFLNYIPAKSFATATHMTYSNRELFIGKKETLYQTVWGG